LPLSRANETTWADFFMYIANFFFLLWMLMRKISFSHTRLGWDFCYVGKIFFLCRKGWRRNCNRML
jgi:hypothetical protein